MKITIKSTNLEISEAIKVYIEKKVESFEGPIRKYFAKPKDIIENPIEIRKERIKTFWEIGAKSSGAKRGLFFCKVRVTIGGLKDLIAEAETGDLYEAIDKVKDMIISQMVEIKDKPISVKKRASRKAKRDFSIDPAAKEREGGRMRNESA